MVSYNNIYKHLNDLKEKSLQSNYVGRVTGYFKGCSIQTELEYLPSMEGGVVIILDQPIGDL